MAAPPASHQGEAGSPLSAYPAPGQGPAVLALLPVQAQGPSEWFGPMSVFTAQSGSCRLLIAKWRDERDMNLVTDITFAIRKTTSVRRPPPLSLSPLCSCLLLTNPFPYPSSLRSANMQARHHRIVVARPPGTVKGAAEGKRWRDGAAATTRRSASVSSM